MLTLGIETSCDETSVAVVRSGKDVLSNIVSSSLPLHKRYGGVVPEIASRHHLEAIAPVFKAALDTAGCDLGQIGAVCATFGPGLAGSLLVGTSFARALAFCREVPLVKVDHVHSHIYAACLGRKVPMAFPFIGFVASGGHTDIFFVRDFNRMELMGSTLDDAVGESFDKVARILGLGYPGGPEIEKLASQGDPGKIRFSCANMKGTLNFSFSGIKTAVLYYTKGRKISRALKTDICASFQKAVAGVLIDKVLSACRAKGAGRLFVGGGVMSNSYLRHKLSGACHSNGIEMFMPAKEHCLDNAAMAAGLGFQLLKLRGGHVKPG